MWRADGSSVLLTRAAGREACSPGRVGLVLIQFICGCVQHHQEKKSCPQRHRPLNTGYTTKLKETPPAVCVIHKNDAPRNKLLQRPGDGADSGCDKWAAGYFLFLRSFFISHLQIPPLIFFFIISFTFDHSLSSPLALTDRTDVKPACVYMGALNITSCA